MYVVKIGIIIIVNMFFVDAQNETHVSFYIDHALCWDGGRINCCLPFASPTYKFLKIK
jgi:hypothetical protein